ncbi:ABC transporter ATP-binding protein [Caenimonas soli]|uniref:ABC transporter ATP-binding protein n=1 Tax=Caenimonas soli TaxID=2735555 RepID=UPI001554176B|nr:ABC transporter ATP-binding protein [Caenimonas soli]NPC55816.1 ABC transporter ATP-binding protein [Caenimonas soli]
MKPAPLLSVRGLGVQFGGERKVEALSDLSFDLGAGEVLGMLGESGSGKSVTLRTLLRLHAPRTTRITGQVTVGGQDVFALGGAELQRYRGATVAMVFQEPGLAFDPVYTIGAQIAESVRAHEAVDGAAARARALEMLERVQIPQARRRLDAYPHELSGGMRQRAMIALALACRPRLLLADEPTTALDATVQIQILLLLRELQREMGMSVIFVTHDIGAAVEVADRIAVMYAGRIVEENAVGALVASPRHPYTAGLLASAIGTASRGRPLPTVGGSPPDLSALPPGCAFAQRCGAARARCRAELPPLAHEGTQALACWHPLPLGTAGA